MPRRALIPILAAAIFVPALTLPADAQTKRTTTVKSSKSNTSDRMGGGGGKGQAGRATTVKSSKSNTSDRRGGGGAGGLFLNPQPEPPGKAKSR